MPLVAGYALAGFTGFSVLVSALPIWLSQVGATSAVAGQVTTVMLGATVVSQFTTPRLVLWIGETNTLVFGLVMLGAPSIGFLLNGAVWWVLLLSIPRGVGFGAFTVMGSAMTAQVVPPSRRGEAIGIYGLAVAMPTVLAVPGGVALTTTGHFVPTVVLSTAPLVGLAAVPALSRALRYQRDTSSTCATPVGHLESKARGVRPISRHFSPVAYSAAIPPTTVLLVVTLAGGGFLTYVPLGVDSAGAATASVLAWSIAGAVARWRAGLRSDRSGPEVLLLISLALAVGGLAVFVVGMLTGDGLAASSIMVVGALVFGVGYGAVQNLTLVVAFLRAGRLAPAVVSSIWNIGFDAGLALGGALVGGLLAFCSIPFALGATIVPMLACLPLVARSMQPPR